MLDRECGSVLVWKAVAGKAQEICRNSLETNWGEELLSMTLPAEMLTAIITGREAAALVQDTEISTMTSERLKTMQAQLLASKQALFPFLALFPHNKY